MTLKQELRAQQQRLRAQLDAAIRKARAESYQAGYEAAVRDLSEATAAGETATPVSRPRSRVATEYVAKPPRGTNAKIVLEALRSVAPRAAGSTEIRVIVKNANGIEMPSTSVRHAIDQLEQRGKIEQVDDTRTWRIVGNG